MPDIGNDDLPIGIKKLVVFKIGRDKNIRFLCNCLAQEATS